MTPKELPVESVRYFGDRFPASQQRWTAELHTATDLRSSTCPKIDDLHGTTVKRRSSSLALRRPATAPFSERYMDSFMLPSKARAADILGLLSAPARQTSAAVFCIDQKTAIQALDRLDPV